MKSATRVLDAMAVGMEALRFGCFVAGIVGLALLVIWPSSPYWH